MAAVHLYMHTLNFLVLQDPMDVSKERTKNVSAILGRTKACLIEGGLLLAIDLD